MGATGRIGGLIISQINQTEDLTLTYAIGEQNQKNGGSAAAMSGGLPVEGVVYSEKLPEQKSQDCDVFIDFSVPEATQLCLDFCLQHSIPLVIGTTGHISRQQAKIDKAAAKIPILQSANMSAAVNASFMLVEQATALLGEEYDVEIAEKHHKHKLDAPSGTALEFGKRVAKARGKKLDEIAVFDRSGVKSARIPGSIGFQSVRGGSIVGEHDTVFINDDEIITISHKAYSRKIFASGALKAARWLISQAPARYAIADMLEDLNPAKGS